MKRAAVLGRLACKTLSDARGLLGIRFAHELIEAIRPISLVRFIANVNPRPPTANEIGGLQDGPYRGNPKECRMNAVRVVDVDRK